MESVSPPSHEQSHRVCSQPYEIPENLKILGYNWYTHLVVEDAPSVSLALPLIHVRCSGRAGAEGFGLDLRVGPQFPAIGVAHALRLPPARGTT